MNDLIKQVLLQSPGLAVFVIVVVLFLRTMERRDSFIKQLHDEHIQARRESQTAIHDNTSATRELTQTINEWRLKD